MQLLQMIQAVLILLAFFTVSRTSGLKDTFAVGGGRGSGLYTGPADSTRALIYNADPAVKAVGWAKYSSARMQELVAAAKALGLELRVLLRFVISPVALYLEVSLVGNQGQLKPWAAYIPIGYLQHLNVMCQVNADLKKIKPKSVVFLPGLLEVSSEYLKGRTP